jgi:hypothetical protein
MGDPINDRRSLYLLLSLLLIILLSPFLGTHRVGEFFLLIALFVTLTVAVLELHGKRTLRWLAITVATPIVLVELAGVFYLSRLLMILDYVLLMAFFGFSSVGLFTYLGKPGAISSGRLYASVSLYLMLATFWFALYNLTEAIYPVKTGHETYEVGGDFPRSIKSREADANGFRQGDGSGEIKGKMLFNRKDYGMNKGIAFYAPPQPNLCEGLGAPEQR